jgi:Tol biopolymer transport system component
VYFASNRQGGFDKKGDIWRANHSPGKPLEVENIGAIVNSKAWDWGPCIAPDESYLIFISERLGGFGYSDLYISFKNMEGSWTSPVNMEKNGTGINLKDTGTGSATISPDGKYLFFSRSGDIYWISSNIIYDIKKEVLNTNTIE